MQIDDILILVDNNIICSKENAMKLAKIITKDVKSLIFAHSLKFNNT